ncbi:hypothetical protein NECAME_19052 [Necator americanus]|uniref:Uncharacterized protein n=1 Tax=Necator americanus TaxID=51031 RepID=W2SQW2_NECAM|nr:hypothetical protein NECAME_19052 [Necator americanus]ETN72020.1 hypothetical protein NECAME_19052 [Necator americanus]
MDAPRVPWNYTLPNGNVAITMDRIFLDCSSPLLLYIVYGFFPGKYVVWRKKMINYRIFFPLICEIFE